MPPGCCIGTVGSIGGGGANGAVLGSRSTGTSETPRVSSLAKLDAAFKLLLDSLNRGPSEEFLPTELSVPVLLFPNTVDMNFGMKPFFLPPLDALTGGGAAGG